ncbi:MAG: 2-oxo acid dehydrogenase subunit E2 [Planctomycetota bacterium]
MFGRRPDGKLAETAPYRRFMPLLMPGRNESAVSFELTLDLSRAEPFLAELNAERPDRRATLFHLVMWGLVRTLHERPHLNRFVAGGRIWDRDGIWLSFAAKQQRLAEDAPLVVLKRCFDPAASLREVIEALHGAVEVGRSGARTQSDRELDALLALPGCGARLALWLGRLLDGWGLLPRAMLEADPFYASVFVANLGSLNLDAATHHLYEWGTVPIFCTIGRVQDAVVPVGGVPAVRRQGVLRFSYDERIEDGLYAGRALARLKELLEDPAAFQ